MANPILSKHAAKCPSDTLAIFFDQGGSNEKSGRRLDARHPPTSYNLYDVRSKIDNIGCNTHAGEGRARSARGTAMLAYISLGIGLCTLRCVYFSLPGLNYTSILRIVQHYMRTFRP